MIKKYYIGTKYGHNDIVQHYIAYDQLTVVDAKNKEDWTFGVIVLTAYDTKDEYVSELGKITHNGQLILNYKGHN